MPAVADAATELNYQPRVVRFLPGRYHQGGIVAPCLPAVLLTLCHLATTSAVV